MLLSLLGASFRGALVGCMLAATSLLLSPTSIWAQAPAKAEAKADADDTKAKKPAKPRGRLPAYFGRVVSVDQKEAIYKIQAEFSAKIAALLTQIEGLRKEQTEKVEEVLTPDQRRQVAKLKEDAKAAREARAAARRGKTSGDESGEAGDDESSKDGA